MVHYPQHGGMRYGTGFTRERHDDRDGPSSDTAWSREPEDAGQAPRHQPEDRREVEEAYGRQGSADRPEGSSFDGAEYRGGGRHRGIPPSHAAAAGRLPLCTAGDDPAPDALVAAPLSAAARHQPVARGDRRQGTQAQVQDIPDRLLSYRSRRGADRRRQATPVRGNRPHLQVRLRRTAQASRQDDRRPVPAQSGRGGPLHHPHRAHG